MNSPLDSLAASIYHALGRLEPITALSGKVTPLSVRDCSVTMFDQTWSDTCLGFPGIGGQSFTSAYTVIVEGPNLDYAVYFGGRFAYCIKDPSHKFFVDMANRSMAEVGKTAAYVRQRSVANSPKPCDHCRGSGKMAKIAILPEPPDVACPNCNGSGKVYGKVSDTTDSGRSNTVVQAG